jgi:hypothetical protein
MCGPVRQLLMAARTMITRSQTVPSQDCHVRKMGLHCGIRDCWGRGLSDQSQDATQKAKPPKAHDARPGTKHARRLSPYCE